MKILIVTLSKINNFGSVLQCFALSEYLKNKGNEVLIYDYDDQTIFKNYCKLKTRLKNLIGDFFYLKNFKNRKKYENQNINSDLSVFLKKRITFSKTFYDSDLIIFGSDQIWNPYVVRPSFTGSSFIGKKKISYAACVGVQKLSYKQKQLYMHFLNDFASISVRDFNSKKQLENLTTKNVEITIDPVFLLSKSSYEKISTESSLVEKNFGLVFLIGDNAFNVQKAYQLCRKKKLKIVVFNNSRRLAFFAKDAKIIRDLNVSDFLYLIKNASYIVTDSYHCLLFSKMFDKEIFILNKHSKLSIKNENSRLNEFSNLCNKQIEKLIENSKKFLDDEINLEKSAK